MSNLLKEQYMSAGITEEVYDFCDRIADGLKERFEKIDEVAQINQIKVLCAMQKERVSAGCFESSTGYGYDDLGRETLEAVYADVFSCRIGTCPSAAYLRNTRTYYGFISDIKTG